MEIACGPRIDPASIIFNRTRVARTTGTCGLPRQGPGDETYARECEVGLHPTFQRYLLPGFWRAGLIFHTMQIERRGEGSRWAHCGLR